MIRPEEVYKIGTFGKPHGIHGELQMNFTDDIFDRVEADYVVCSMEGILVPFFIDSYRIRTATTALMKLEDVDSVEQARRFSGLDIYFPLALLDEADEELLPTWAALEGCRVEEVEHGHLGELVAVDDSTANVLLVIRPADGEELLVPACEEFVVGFDPRHRVMTLRLPEGLLNL